VKVKKLIKEYYSYGKRVQKSNEEESIGSKKDNLSIIKNDYNDFRHIKSIKIKVWSVVPAPRWLKWEDHLSSEAQDYSEQHRETSSQKKFY
jgi:ABC-type ATPase with predicted acetyltransferase domain